MNKEHWPEFPLVWLEESRRNMAGLHDLAVHLHQKTEASRMRDVGFRGDTTDMEKQIIERLGSIQQDVSVLTDVVQAMLPIIYEDHWRRSHRTTRAVAWMRETIGKYWHEMEQNGVYRVLAALGVLATLSLIIRLLWHSLHSLRR